MKKKKRKGKKAIKEHYKRDRIREENKNITALMLTTTNTTIPELETYFTS